MSIKRKYEFPQAVAELFCPEESISSCYSVGCEYGAAGGEKGIHAPESFVIDGTLIPGDLGVNDVHGKTSKGTGCGWEENQVAKVGSDGKIESLKEINVLNYKTMDCNVLKQDGNKVYWTTQSGKDRLWSHMGTLKQKSSNHPNMS